VDAIKPETLRRFKNKGSLYLPLRTANKKEMIKPAIRDMPKNTSNGP